MAEHKLDDLFKTKEKVTPNRIRARRDALRAVSGFKCETEEHRKARMAVFFNLDNYERAVRVVEDKIDKPSPEIRKMNHEKDEAAKRCGGVERQLENGQVAITNVTDPQKYAAEVAKIEMKYKSALQAEYERLAENNELLNTEVPSVPDPHFADPTWFPDSIGPDKLADISFMLKDMSEKGEGNEKEENESS